MKKTVKILIFIIALMISTSAYSEVTVKKGATSQLAEVYVTHSTTGAGLTGLVYNAAGLTCYYYRSGAASSTVISLATMTLGTWATGGVIVVDGTNMPGMYQIGIPNAALITGTEGGKLYCQGAADMKQLITTVNLVDNIESDTYTRIGTAGAGLTNIDLPNQTMDITGSISGSIGSVGSGGITATSIATDAITDTKITDTLEKRMGWVAAIDLTSNAGTFVLSLNSEGVSVTNQFRGMKLYCGNESREIVASASGTPDTVTTEPFNPWPAAPTSSTCTVRN